MRLDISLDFGLFDSIEAAAAEAKGDMDALRESVAAIVADTTLFAQDQKVVREGVDDLFDLAAMQTRGFWDEQGTLRSFMTLNLDHVVASLGPYLPARSDTLSMAMKVHVVPGFATCYGAADRIQVFALHAGAEPEEALLFLAHICYHEVSSLFYSDASRRAAASPDTPERFRHWLLLLIQNEGIANYAVLDPVLRLRNLGLPLLYFTYAPVIGDPRGVSQAMTFIRETLRRLDQESVNLLRGHVSEILKNPRLPVINLVGIHLAQVVARKYGEPALLDVIGRQPQELFRLYLESGDELSEHLFGPEAGDLTTFGLVASDALSDGP